jgi:hypothetical protein
MPAARVYRHHVQPNCEHLRELHFRTVQTPAVRTPSDVEAKGFYFAGKTISMPNGVATAVAVGLVFSGLACEPTHLTQELANPITDVGRPADVYETAVTVGQAPPRMFRHDVQAWRFRRPRIRLSNSVAEIAADLIGAYPPRPRPI